MYDFLYVFKYSDENVDKAAQRLRCSIDSIKHNENINIIVCNHSKKCIREYFNNIGVSINYHHYEVEGDFNKPILINHAVDRYIKTEYFFFSDIDLVYEKNYLLHILVELQNEKPPSRVVPFNYNIYEDKYSCDWEHLMTLEKSGGGYAHGNGLMHRKSFLDIGGYNEKMIGYGPEDDEFNQRLSKINRLVYREDIITVHLLHKEFNRIQTEENSKIFHETLDKIDKIDPAKHHVHEFLPLLNVNEDKEIGVISDIENNWWKNLPEQEKELKFWSKNNGEDLRYKYPLDKNSIVFDVGGYIGEWSKKIYDIYTPTLYVFEPVKYFFGDILKRFGNNILFDSKDLLPLKDTDNISVEDVSNWLYMNAIERNYNNKLRLFNFGLGDRNRNESICLNKDSSSIFDDKEKYETENIIIYDFMEFINTNKIHHICLLKLNIEGGEYEILQQLIDSKYIDKVTDLQIQFHHIEEESAEKRKKLQEQLSKTHYFTYKYDWIWENWRKK